MKIQEEIIEQMFDLFRLFREEMMGKCKSHNLTIIQVHVLLLLKKEKIVKMKDVAKKLVITMPSATKLLDKMVEINLVTRKNDKNDRRNVMLELTDKGKYFLEKSTKIRNEMISDALKKLTEKEKINLLNTLKKIKNTYEK